MAAGVGLDPGLSRSEDDPDPARSLAGVVAGCLTLAKDPPVAADQRVDIATEWPTGSR
jgi:hypothetical protein